MDRHQKDFIRLFENKTEDNILIKPIYREVSRKQSIPFVRLLLYRFSSTIDRYNDVLYTIHYYAMRGKWNNDRFRHIFL